MTDPLRVTVVGLGAMGANHARVYREIAGVRLAATVDLDPDRSVGDVPHFDDHARMLAEVRPDAVSVCVPTRAHFVVAAAFIEQGIAVLIEKPLAATIEEGERLRDLAEAARVPLAVGHIERFNPAVIELKRRLAAGELGRVYQVHARRVGPFPQRVRDVGVVLDLAPHDIDVMRFLLESDVVRVQAETERRLATEHEDMLSGVVRFSNGVVGVLDVNWLTPTKIRELSVLGEHGMFVVDYLSRSLTFFENSAAPAPSGDLAWASRHEKGVTEGKRIEITVEKREPLRSELEAFVSAARGETPVAVTADDGLAAMRAAAALIEAAAVGAPVEVARA
jgi:predicted dehydrogenase